VRANPCVVYKNVNSAKSSLPFLEQILHLLVIANVTGRARYTLANLVAQTLYNPLNFVFTSGAYQDSPSSLE
jgi:hypothetical protein